MLKNGVFIAFNLRRDVINKEYIVLISRVDCLSENGYAFNQTFVTAQRLSRALFQFCFPALKRQFYTFSFGLPF